MDIDANYQLMNNKKSMFMYMVNRVLYQIRKTVPRTLQVSIFNALIQSHLSYGISAYQCGVEVVTPRDLMTCLLLRKLLELCLV